MNSIWEYIQPQDFVNLPLRSEDAGERGRHRHRARRSPGLPAIHATPGEAGKAAPSLVHNVAGAGNLL
jgi:hypothetical protein